jgi:hypothetical protein
VRCTRIERFWPVRYHSLSTPADEIGTITIGIVIVLGDRRRRETGAVQVRMGRLRARWRVSLSFRSRFCVVPVATICCRRHDLVQEKEVFLGDDEWLSPECVSVLLVFLVSSRPSAEGEQPTAGPPFVTRRERSFGSSFRIVKSWNATHLTQPLSFGMHTPVLTRSRSFFDLLKVCIGLLGRICE